MEFSRCGMELHPNITDLFFLALKFEMCSFQAVWPHSGHYRPTEQNFQEFMNFLKDRSVELTDVKVVRKEPNVWPHSGDHPRRFS